MLKGKDKTGIAGVDRLDRACLANAKDGPLHKAEKYTFQTQPSAQQALVNSEWLHCEFSIEERQKYVPQKRILGVLFVQLSR